MAQTHHFFGWAETLVDAVGRWIDGRRGGEALAAKTPDQREDIGLTLGDMRSLGV